ncbi:12743_t:CDS:2 [Ambispora leptoticha]|uniref:12743_t:CDS:1 n=1 Tax=Ambispora leptoticha TaxID=144679 RepID=A0A9N9B793_9GLOM|nr:12743_t:CDS:2 [Ambispora leptoticha]
MVSLLCGLDEKILVISGKWPNICATAIDSLNFSRLQLARALKEDLEDANALPPEKSAIFSRQRPTRHQNGDDEIKVPNHFHIPRPTSLKIPMPLTTQPEGNAKSPHLNDTTPNKRSSKPQQLNTNARNSVAILGDINLNDLGVAGNRHSTLMDVRKSIIESRHMAIPFSPSSSHRTKQLMHQRSFSSGKYAPLFTCNHHPPKKQLPPPPTQLASTIDVRPPSIVENPQSPTRLHTQRDRRPLSSLQISTKSPSRPQSAYANNNSTSPIPPHSRPSSTYTSDDDKDENKQRKNIVISSSLQEQKFSLLPPIKGISSSTSQKKSDESDHEVIENIKEEESDGSDYEKIGKIIMRRISSPRPQLDKVIENPALKITLHPSNDIHRLPKDNHVAAWITDVSKQALTVEPVKTARHSHRRRQSNVERSTQRMSSHEHQTRRPRSALFNDELLPPSPHFAKPRQRSNSDNTSGSRPKSLYNAPPLLAPIPVSNSRQDSGIWAKDTLLALSEDYQSLASLMHNNNSYPSPGTTPPPKGPGEFYMNGSRSRNGSNTSLNKALLKHDSGSDAWRGHRRENSSGSSAGSHRSFYASSGNNSPVHMMHSQGMRSRDSLNNGFSNGGSSSPINPRRRTSMENVHSNRGSVYISQQSKHRTR